LARISHRNGSSLHFVSNAKFVSLMSFGPKSYSEILHGSIIYAPIHDKRVTQIGVTDLVKGAKEPNPPLHSSNYPRKTDLLGFQG
jgi:hypothetical protein